MRGIKQRVFTIVEQAKPGNRISRAFDWIIISLIGVSVVQTVIESEPAITAHLHEPTLFWLDRVIVTVFVIEYLARVWSCTADAAYRHPVTGRIRFAFRPMQLIDLIAILPSLIALGDGNLKVLRAARLLRLLKVGRYSKSMRLFSQVLHERKGELVLTVAVASALLLIASTLMYVAERNAQPEAFGSIPRALWWGVITLTTVGYGDIYPITGIGKVLGAVIAALGVGLVAVPTGIIGAGLGDVLERRRKSGYSSVCPTCGRAHEPVVEPPGAG